MFFSGSETCYNYSEERQFLSMSISQTHFASGGFAPWTPNRALPLYPARGLGSPQTPRLCGGLRPPVLSTFTISPPTSNLIDNPGFVYMYSTCSCGSRSLKTMQHLLIVLVALVHCTCSISVVVSLIVKKKGIQGIEKHLFCFWRVSSKALGPLLC